VAQDEAAYEATVEPEHLPLEPKPVLRFCLA